MHLIIAMLLLSGRAGDRLLDVVITHELAQMDDRTELQDGDLTVVFGGTGTLSTDTRAGSSVAVLADGEVLLFDTGPGSTRVLGSHDVPLSEVSTVLYTHLHSDHTGDLGELTVASELLGRDAPLTVLGPPGTEAMVHGFEQAYAHDHELRSAQHPGHLAPANAEHLVQEFEVEVPTVVLEHGALRVTAIPVDHRPVEQAYGYRIDQGPDCVVISGDTRFHPALAEAARGCDVLIHEAMDKRLAEQIAQHSEPRRAALIRDALVNHSSATDAAKVAELAGVDTLVLTHVSPPLVLPNLKARMTRQARGVFDGRVRLAEDGMTLEVR